MGRFTKAAPEKFELETTTLWSFPEHGSWATHDSKWRGNWSPYVPRNLILRYSRERDWVLDPFVGGGTTLVEARLLNRNSIGVDINSKAVETSLSKVGFRLANGEGELGEVVLKKGDARNLDFIEDGRIDLICAHPPYADIIRYSDGIAGDLSRMGTTEFLAQMRKVAAECFRVLKKGGFCAVLIGDTRSHGNAQPLGFRLMDVFQAAGFVLRETIIKAQHNCRSTAGWKKESEARGFLLLAHEHLFVFRK